MFRFVRPSSGMDVHNLKTTSEMVFNYVDPTSLPEDRLVDRNM